MRACIKGFGGAGLGRAVGAALALLCAGAGPAAATALTQSWRPQIWTGGQDSGSQGFRLQAAGPQDPYRLCDQAIVAAERSHALPPRLLGAIGRVETGRRDPATGALVPWPWAVDVEGEGHLYDTEAQAIAAVRGFQAAGRRSIDVGCMQINLMHHPDAFASLESAFDPASNASYAAELLTRLHGGDTAGGSGGWLHAAALYHSATPAIGEPYRERVAALMGQPVGQDGGFTLAANSPSPSLFPLPPAGAPRAALQQMQAGPPAFRPAGFTGRDLAGYRARPVRLAG